ncbi:hypothetical protein [uncultured Dokdonia sp.]|uniref:hypothetical protein n=1 Tax=uncultured Dokdonia sp. TaxID=575653 RepID=UPI00261AD8AA|nr:hypothetical protein [uncultured Dokdonia sp.]
MNILTRHFNYILVGSICIIIDVSISNATNGKGLNLDFINDFLGASLIFVGVRYLLINTTSTSQQYYSYLKTALYTASISIYFGALDFFVFPQPSWFIILNMFLQLFVIYGAITFCKAMFILTDHAEDFENRNRWKTAQSLIIYLTFIPYTLILINSIFELTESNTYIDLSARWTLYIIHLLSIPFVYFIWVLYTTKQHIKQV